LPAFAQTDVSGQWSDRYHEDWPERIPGPDAVDLSGLPLTEAGRAKADSWNVSVQTLPERQCIPHMATYGLQGPANLRIWNEVDPTTGRVLAWKIFGTFGRTTETIWMDGRPHPSPRALHTFEGFTTGEWEGDTLVTYTTHIKMGYLRRNGVPSSDRSVVVSHIVRHGEILTITTIVEDPIYLSEPFIRSHSWELDPKQQVLPTPCEPVVEVPRPKGVVPHFLPGENPFVGEVTKLYGIPKDYVSHAVIYNKTLLDAAGVETPKAGWLWADVLESDYPNAQVAVRTARVLEWITLVDHANALVVARLEAVRDDIA